MMENQTHHRWDMAHLTPTSDYPSQLPSHVSPYLVPQWAYFWTRVWKNTQAECWHEQSPSHQSLLIAVRRRRALWNWVFCLPYGTPGAVGIDVSELDELLGAIADSQTVQVSLAGVRALQPIDGWRSSTLEFASHVLDLRDMTETSPLTQATDHHQRNIEKGSAASIDIQIVRTAEDVRRLQSAWQRGDHSRSRIVLNAKRGPLLAEVFAGNEAMTWMSSWHEGRPVATCLWLILGGHAVYVDGAVDRSAPAGVNHHLFAHVLTMLYGRGVRSFDFGGGPLGQSSEGLVRFKEGWGALPEPRYETVFRRPRYDTLHRIVR